MEEQGKQRESHSQEGTNSAALWLSSLSSSFPPSLVQFPCLFDSLLSQNLVLDLSRSTPHHLFFQLVVSESITNRYSTLHGGAIGAFIEILACFAVKSASGSKEGIVTDINISYISGTEIKEEVEFEAKVLKLGENNAVASVDVRNRRSGKVAAQGRVTMCFEPTSKL